MLTKPTFLYILQLVNILFTTMYISILVYGQAGSGKSIFASTFPNALVLDADNGHKLYEPHFPQHTYVKSANCLSALQNAVVKLQKGEKLETKDGKPIDTIIIDSLTNIENTAVANMKGLHSGNWSEYLYTGKGKKLDYNDWGGVSGSTIALLTYLRELPINLVVITQVETKLDGGKRIFSPNLIGKGADEALHFADFVGFMSVADGTEGAERYLHLTSTINDNFVAKSRTIQGATAPIKNPSYEKILKLVEKTKPKLNFTD